MWISPDSQELLSAHLFFMIRWIRLCSAHTLSCLLLHVYCVITTPSWPGLVRYRYRVPSLLLGITPTRRNFSCHCAPLYLPVAILTCTRILLCLRSVQRSHSGLTRPGITRSAVSHSYSGSTSPCTRSPPSFAPLYTRLRSEWLHILGRLPLWLASHLLGA